jgi:acyl carrier protein
MARERTETDMTEIRDRIIQIVAEQAMLDPAELKLDMSPQDLGIDSLGLVESIFAIEEEFDISVPFNANEPEKSDFDISSLGAIVAAVEKLVAEKV